MAYRGEAAICNACPAKARCTTSDHGRKVQRSFFIDYVEKVRSYHATEPYKKAIRKRQVWVEPLFAEAKEWHGLRRLRLRGLLNANIQGLLIAAAEPEAVPGCKWVGPTSCSLWKPPGPPNGVTRALGHLRVTISSAGTRDGAVGRSAASANAHPCHRPSFQHLGPFSAPTVVSTNQMRRNQARRRLR